MSVMSLEAEKNELIRWILDVGDAVILWGMRSMLSCEEKQTNVAAEEATPYWTEAEILASLDQARKELKLSLESKLEFKSLDDTFNEIQNKRCPRIFKGNEALAKTV